MHIEFDVNSTHCFKRPHRHHYKKETLDLLKVFYLRVHMRIGKRKRSFAGPSAFVLQMV